MSGSTMKLRRRIESAEELESVVRTMKALAASSITQYENAVRALDDYYRTVQLGLAALFRNDPSITATGLDGGTEPSAIGAVVFGSDQGLVGQFNDIIVDYAVKTLAPLPGKKTVWAVGERIYDRLNDTNLVRGERLSLPGSIGTITPLIGQILIDIDARREDSHIGQIFLFHNCPKRGSVYTPVSQRLLPLDDQWRLDQTAIPWPTNNLPEVIGGQERTLHALVREYLFISLFRACAESLASENASRLASMQRAEKNIDELLEDMNRNYHRSRQNSIDEELFDVVAGFEALKTP